MSESELQVSNITPYHVTKSYREQIVKSGYYDQLKYIVEPSIREFDSPGTLDTSGEHDNTVVPGLQHKYAETGLLLVTERCGSYCRYCFRKRIVGKISDEIAPDFGRVAQYIARHPEMTNVLLSGGDPFVLSTSNLKQDRRPSTANRAFEVDQIWHKNAGLCDLPLHFHPAAVRVLGFFVARPNFGPPRTRVLRSYHVGGLVAPA